MVGRNQHEKIKTFMNINLQLSSSLWSKQLDVWSHLVTTKKAHKEKDFVRKQQHDIVIWTKYVWY